MPLNPSITSSTAVISPKGDVTEPNLASIKTPSVLSTAPAKSAINDSLTKLQDILNPQSSYYQQNLGFLRPGETPEQYFTRTGTPKPEEKTAEKPTEIPKETAPKTEISPDQQAQIDAFQSNIKTFDAEAQAVRDKMTAIQNGTYVDPMTQNLLNTISTSYDSLLSKQADINKATLAGFTQAGIRSGRSRYAPDIETSNLNAVMQKGLDKLQEITDKKNVAIAKAKSASDTNDFNQLYKQMQDFEKQSAEETKHMVDFQKEMRQAEKDAEQRIKDQQTLAKNQQAMDLKDAQSAAYTVFNFLNQNPQMSDEEHKSAIQEYASANKLNPAMLLNEVEKLETTKNRFYGSGPIGEYNFAKDKGGFTGSFPDWLKYKKSIGKTSPAQKEFSFTPKQSLDLESKGLNKATQQAIINDLKGGASENAIRAEMKRNNLDPALLDAVLGYIRPKGSSSSSFK